MKKLIFAASAVALGTTAVANEPEAHDEAKATPDAAETSVYDGPDSYTPSQPPPTAEGQVAAQRLDLYQPVARASYPVCTETVRDNCVQRIDPGGSDIELAAQGSTGINAPGTSFTGTGGPEVEADATTRTAIDAVAEPEPMEEPGDTTEPEPEPDY